MLLLIIAAPFNQWLHQTADQIALLALLVALLSLGIGIYQVHYDKHPAAARVCIVLGVICLLVAYKSAAKETHSDVSPPPSIDPTPLPTPTPTPPIVLPPTPLPTPEPSPPTPTPIPTIPTPTPISTPTPTPAPTATLPLNQLDDLEDEVVQIASRGEVIDASLARMREEQAKVGVGLRNDMAERQSSMHNNLVRAKEALANRDIDRAKKALDRALQDIEVLEHFLGR